MDLNRLVEIFKNANAQKAIDQMVNIAVRLGLSTTTIDFLRDMLFGYIETYLNGATCPNCFTYLGDAREVPDFTICLSCGRRIGTIKINPLRLYLAIANNEDLFRIIPDKIKVPDKLGIVKRFGSVVLKFYDAVTMDLIFEPLMEWMKAKRPDLYYTIALYPILAEPIQELYQLDFGYFGDEDIKRVAQKYGLPTDVNSNELRKTLREVLIEGLELAFERKLEKWKQNPESVSFQGIKTFYHQIHVLKAKMGDILERYIKEG